MGTLYATDYKHHGRRFYHGKFQEWLDQQVCFSATLSEPKFPSRRLNKRIEDSLPKLTYDVLGSTAIHPVVHAYPPNHLGLVLPATEQIKQRGYAKVEIADMAGDELHSKIEVNYVFKDPFSEQERELIRKVIGESYRFVFQELLGYSRSHMKRTLKKTANFWASVYFPDESAEFGRRRYGTYKGDLNLKINPVIDDVFKEIDDVFKEIDDVFKEVDDHEKPVE